MVASEINIPSRAQCEQLWEDYHTPAHIRRHCALVGAVARVLAEELVAAGQELNVQLCEAAGMLHDLVRITEWKELSFEFFDAEPSPEDIAVWEQQRARWSPDVPHAEVNAEILRDAYPEVATIVAKHSVNSVGQLHTWEEKVVHYADRRVMHDQFASVEKRFADFAERYPSMDPDGHFLELTLELEKQLFELLSMSPDQLKIAV